MSDRNVIAAHERVPRMRLATCMCGWEEPIRGRDVTALHAAHVADALRESRTARTVEELDALPDGSIVLNQWQWKRGEISASHYEKVFEYRGPTRSSWWDGHISQTSEQVIAESLAEDDMNWSRLIVLYRPDEDGAM